MTMISTRGKKKHPQGGNILVFIFIIHIPILVFRDHTRAVNECKESGSCLFYTDQVYVNTL